MSLEAFLTNPTAPIVIDLRGGSKKDPAIPGSKRVYILDLVERTKEFEKRFEANLSHRTLLLYCSKGDGSKYLQQKFSSRYHVQSLQGGMVGYLEAISGLLYEHPYESTIKRTEVMAKILAALTNRETDPDTFKKIIDRLLRCSPNEKFKKLLD
ncbi:MAG: hypothetical protein H7839_00330 [Magnetococcus sp. YQC-5]